MSVKKISWLGLFIALSVIGSVIKVPAPVSSVALDSFPALVSAVLLGPALGALVATLGHLAAALTGGFPMGPFHLIIAVEMAAAVWVFGKVSASGRKWPAFFLFVMLNGIAAPAPFIFFMGVPFYVSSVPAITVAACLNGILAHLLAPRLLPFFEKHFGRFYA